MLGALLGVADIDGSLVLHVGPATTTSNAHVLIFPLMSCEVAVTTVVPMLNSPGVLSTVRVGLGSQSSIVVISKGMFALSAQLVTEAFIVGLMPPAHSAPSTDSTGEAASKKV